MSAKGLWAVAPLFTLAAFLDISVQNVQVPLLPQLRRELFGDSGTLLSLYVGSYGFGSALSILSFPKTTQNFTTKQVILSAQCVFVLCCVVLSLNIGYFDPELWRWVAITARFFQGVCSGMLWIASSILLFDLYFSTNTSTFEAALYSMYASESFGIFVAPAIGGFLGLTSFCLIAALSAVIILLFVIVVPSQGDLKAVDKDFEFLMFLKHFRTQSQVGVPMYIAILVAGCVITTVEVVMPQLLDHYYGTSQAEIGVVFAISGCCSFCSMSLVGIVVNRWLGEKWKVPVFAASLMLMANNFLFCWTVSAFGASQFICFLAIGMFGVSDGAVVGGSVLLTDDGVTNRNDIMISFVTFQLVWEFSTTLGPLLASTIDIFSQKQLVGVLSCVTIVCALVSLYLFTHKQSVALTPEKELSVRPFEQLSDTQFTTHTSDSSKGEV